MSELYNIGMKQSKIIDTTETYHALAGGARQVHQVDRSTANQEAGRADDRLVHQRHLGALRRAEQHHHG